eukprot:TRINITY_DN38876_c0_g1_i1.p6 TRINITY_DN38876_c0_g1~~TRINITY_DN38876_c0_g1_i1.p6  ORF type:complete len:117 (+),score=43.39 TRINITY_DN38876_c0_g1_i1:377-727(+)
MNAHGHRIESIDGENALPPPVQQTLATVMQLAFYAGIACTLLGLHTMLPPPLGPWVAENKGQTIMFLFVLNMIAAQLMSTGAFEVFVNDKLVFSKLQTGQVPRLQPLLHSIGEALV